MVHSRLDPAVQVRTAWHLGKTVGIAKAASAIEGSLTRRSTASYAAATGSMELGQSRGIDRLSIHFDVCDQPYLLGIATTTLSPKGRSQLHVRFGTPSVAVDAGHLGRWMTGYAMIKRNTLSIAAGMSLMMVGPAPASVKPCRGKDGRIIECPKERKSSPRCKDERGRFVACPTPASAGSDAKNRATK